MPQITHHIPDTLLMAYATGTLDHAFSIVIASHVSLCDDCRAQLGAHEAVGGTVLDGHPTQAISSTLKDTAMAQLDDLPDVDPDPVYARFGAFPGPVMAALKGRAPRWKPVGKGVRQMILHADDQSSVRLLYIPPGQAVPDHGHGGTELTLVLQGAFNDETGHYGVGDLEVADDTLEHTPVADIGTPCICLAATNAPLEFKGFIPRLLQPFFRI